MTSTVKERESIEQVDEINESVQSQEANELTTEQLEMEDDITEILEKLPDAEKQVVIREMHAGPLPSARQLREYNNISPEIANTIVNMARTQQEHRHKMDEKHYAIEEAAMKKHFFNDNLGMTLGFLVMLVLIIAGVHLIKNNHNIIGFISMMAGLAGPTKVFLKKNNDDENNKNDKIPKN